MVSQKLFESLPPFPDISTADVPKFSLSRLSSGDSAYAHKGHSPHLSQPEMLVAKIHEASQKAVAGLATVDVR